MARPSGLQDKWAGRVPETRCGIGRCAAFENFNTTATGSATIINRLLFVLGVINYYQAPGWGQPIAPDRGFHGKIINFDLAGDQTITHISIDKSARVQAEILQEITALNKAAANTASTITTRSTPTAR